MRIALFATCLADAVFPQAAIATVSLLERLGHQVVFPDKQTCCGQMHINTGYLAEATALVLAHQASGVATRNHSAECRPEPLSDSAAGDRSRSRSAGRKMATRPSSSIGSDNARNVACSPAASASGPARINPSGPAA